MGLSPMVRSGANEQCGCLCVCECAQRGRPRRQCVASGRAAGREARVHGATTSSVCVRDRERRRERRREARPVRARRSSVVRRRSRVARVADAFSLNAYRYYTTAHYYNNTLEDHGRFSTLHSADSRDRSTKHGSSYNRKTPHDTACLRDVASYGRHHRHRRRDRGHDLPRLQLPPFYIVL